MAEEQQSLSESVREWLYFHLLWQAFYNHCHFYCQFLQLVASKMWFKTKWQLLKGQRFVCHPLSVQLHFNYMDADTEKCLETKYVVWLPVKSLQQSCVLFFFFFLTDKLWRFNEKVLSELNRPVQTLKHIFSR